MLFGRKTKLTHATLLDIGSSSVGGAHVSFSSDLSRPLFNYSIRDHFAFHENLDLKQFRLTMIHSLERTLESVSKKTERPEILYCTLSSPWYVTETRVIHLEKQSEFTVSHTLLDDLIAKEIEIFQSRESGTYKDLQSDFTIIESKISHIKLNGYRVDDPIGKKAKNLDLELFVVISPKDIINDIGRRIQKTYPGITVRFVSHSYASFSVARDLFPHEHSFLMLDIGGEVSDVMLVKQDTINSSVSFPYGKHTLIRALSREFSLSPKEFLSIVESYHKGDLSYTETERLAKALKVAEKEWLMYFQKGLVHISNEISVPHVLFVTVDDRYVDWFSDFLKRETFTQYTVSERSFTIIPLSREFLDAYVHVPDSVKKDPLLMFESLFVRKII